MSHFMTTLSLKAQSKSNSIRELQVGSEIGPYKLFRFVFLKKVADDIVNEAKAKK